MMGKIVFDDEPDNIPEADYNGVNFVDKVSCKEIIRYNEEGGRKKVVPGGLWRETQYHTFLPSSWRGSDTRALGL